MAWEMRICVGKPAGVGKKALVLNPKHSLPIPCRDCSYLSNTWDLLRAGWRKIYPEERLGSQNICRLVGAALCALS